MTETVPPTMRDRTRRAVQAELVDLAMRLFLTQGYEQTTVAQIAAAANMSSRTFFRYFASKDDLITQATAGKGEEIVQALASQPMNTPPWTALRQAFEPLITEMVTDERSLAIMRMMLEEPALAPNLTYKHATWSQNLARALEPRLPNHLTALERRLEAEALGHAGMACLLVAQREWVSSGGQPPLSELLDITMQTFKGPENS